MFYSFVKYVALKLDMYNSALLTNSREENMPVTACNKDKCVSDHNQLRAKEETVVAFHLMCCSVLLYLVDVCVLKESNYVLGLQISFF